MSEPRPALAVGIACKDPRAELRWLEAAFGFETTLIVENDDGSIAHSEMRVGSGGQIMVGREWDDFHRSPASIGGLNTQSVHVNLDDADDIDAHFRRAVAAGATVLREPADQFYGDRLYAVRDPEGHQWTFGRRFDATANPVRP
jgi:uncharacterized glyoxalase superfamily protein PhnB